MPHDFSMNARGIAMEKETQVRPGGARCGRKGPDHLDELLVRWHEGDREARDLVATATYHDLQRLAGFYVRREDANHLLSPTALAHEVWLRLMAARCPKWRDHAHFFAVARILMRRILIDRARRQRLGERILKGLGPQRLTADHPWSAADHGRLTLARGVKELWLLHPEAARVVELRFFFGMTIEEAARDLKISPRTVKRRWLAARLWLAAWLRQA
ncbi:MAG: ECF-type sigma factor [Thermoanaerobaculia bacterium]|nr:ECF-type sigma factor [Thermoanaerobaculia bacterium]